jgi:hypothetical protein
VRPAVRIALLVAVAASAPIGVARAQSPEAEAHALFQSARDAMAREDYPQACPMLERSEALDPGIGTAFNLARCYELWGHLASAWATYRRVVGETHAAGESEREQVARGLMGALEPRLAYVTVRAPDPAPAGLEVRLDGAPVGRERWAARIPVDPGAHLVEATAPSIQPFSSRFTIEGEAQEVAVPIVASALATPPRPAIVPALGGPATARAPAGEAAPPGDSFGTPRNWATLGVAGAGLAAIGVGSFFGLRAMSLDSQASSDCNGGSCGEPGYSLVGQAHSAADAATVSFSVGGALLAGAVVLWLTRPHAAQKP